MAKTHRRSILFIAVALSAALALVVTPLSAAGADADADAATVTMSGLVKDNTGTPVVGAKVAVFSPSSTTDAPLTSTDTNELGEFTIVQLPGRYVLGYFAPDDFDLLEVWSGNTATRSSATSIDASSDVSGITAVLVAPATITGRVIERPYNNGAPDIGIGLTPGDNPYTEKPTIVAQTGSDGRFTISGVRPGRYVIEYVGNSSIYNRAGGYPLKATAGKTNSQSEFLIVRSEKPFDKVTRPVVSGNAIVGHTLTASAQPWSPVAKMEYYWTVEAPSGFRQTTGPTYKLRAADAGAYIVAHVYGSVNWYEVVTPRWPAATDSNLVRVPGEFLKTPRPKIVGKAKVGRKLTVKTGAWAPEGAFRYQWLRDGKRIPQATKATYTVSRYSKDKTITVTVTGSRPNFRAVTVRSFATKRVR
jgi:hypothetical protein